MSEEDKNKAKGAAQNPIAPAACQSEDVFNILTQQFVDLRSLPDVEVACSSLNLNANEKRLAIRSIALRKKRQRGYDRILFQGPLNGDQSSRGSNKSIAAEEELKKDRLDYIAFLKRKYRNILPDELFDQSKQLQRQVGKILKIDDIIKMVEEKSQKRAVKKEEKKSQTKPTKDSKKKAANKQKEQADEEEDDSKKKKKPKKKNQQEEGEEDNNMQGEDSLGEVSNQFVNNDDDDAGDNSAGGADDYDYD